MHQKIFEYHGVQFKPSKKQIIQADCPLCLAENKFFVNISTGQFDCKVCGESGNKYSFLQKFHATCLGQTSSKKYSQLSKARGIPVDIITQWQVAWNFLTEKWMFPAYNHKGSIANLYTKEDKGIYSSPDCLQHPLNLQALTTQGTIWLTEGAWDGMALTTILSSIKEVRKNEKKVISSASGKDSFLKDNVVLALPGCNQHKEDWDQYLRKKKVIICFDNDYPKISGISPGWSGSLKLFRKLKNVASKVLLLRWGEAGYSEALKDGFDINDLLRELPPIKSYLRIKKLLVSPKVVEEEDTEETDITPLHRTQFAEVEADYRARYSVSQNLLDCLVLMLATIISTELEGDQVWLRVIGPPSSGKTTLAEGVSADRRYVIPRSVLSGLHSGYRATGKDCSLIPKFQNKTMIIKDGDTLLSSPKRDKILSELRDLFDGSSRSEYLNGEVKIYENIKTTFILCGTDALRLLNRTSLGERFLDCEVVGDGEDTSHYLQIAASSIYQKVATTFQDDKERKDTYLKQSLMGFIGHLKTTLRETPCPTLSKASEGQIIALGRLLTIFRAKVDRETEELGIKPRVEVGARVVSQLIKLAICIGIVLGKKEIDHDVVRIIQKVVKDSGKGFMQEIIKYLSESKGRTTQQVRDYLKCSESQARLKLRELLKLKIVWKKDISNNSDNRGRDSHFWQLHPQVIELLTQGKFE